MTDIFYHTSNHIVWWHHLRRKPESAMNAKLWIEHATDDSWRVEVKVYFPNGDEDRLHGWGLTRHAAFVCLRKRLANFANLFIAPIKEQEYLPDKWELDLSTS